MKTSSGSPRITRGDVQAVLHAFGGGGRAVLLHSRTAEDAPADFVGSHGSIWPFAGSPWDGAHFCADDWHVILIADFEGGDASFQHADAARIMNGLEVSFTLDGAALPTTRTAIKRFLNPGQFGLQVAYLLLLPARPDHVTGRSEHRQPPAGSHDGRRIGSAELPRRDHVRHRRTWHRSLRIRSTGATMRSVA